MSDRPGSRDRYSAAEAALKAERARLLAEVDGIDDALAAIDRDRAGAIGGDAPAPATLVVDPISKREAGSESPFYGLGLGAAAKKQLSLCNRQTQTAKQIWRVLEAAGFKITAKDPVGAVSWALRKRERKIDDVILTNNGQWGLTVWFTPGQIKAFKEARNVATGRDHADHVERTMAGIENAKDRGLKWGRPKTIDPERMLKFIEARAKGHSIKQASAESGLAYSTYQWYLDRYDLINWKRGDPWPPPELTEPRQKHPRKKSAARAENGNIGHRFN
jgi:hypothetical protein